MPRDRGYGSPKVSYGNPYGKPYGQYNPYAPRGAGSPNNPYVEYRRSHVPPPRVRYATHGFPRGKAETTTDKIKNWFYNRFLPVLAEVQGQTGPARESNYWRPLPTGTSGPVGVPNVFSPQVISAGNYPYVPYDRDDRGKYDNLDEGYNILNDYYLQVRPDYPGGPDFRNQKLKSMKKPQYDLATLPPPPTGSGYGAGYGAGGYPGGGRGRGGGGGGGDNVPAWYQGLIQWSF